ncbi:MAG: PadR family transcriptional regulator [Gemmatimonadaceae bacterium]
MPGPRADLLQGTLDLLILQTLLVGPPLHGWAISRRIRERSRETLEVNQGSLYPALYRLESRGLLLADDGMSEQGRRVRIYRLSAAGRRHLASEVTSWRLFATAVEQILQPA